MEILTGKVERIKYRDENDGYTIMSVATGRDFAQKTVICNVIEVREGDRVRAAGDWVDHKKYGRQFQASYVEIAPPSDEEGLFNFLTATVKGIGETTARAIIERFGMKAIDVMDNHPERLKEVPGIGAARLKGIIESWEKGRAMREVMIWLQKYGVTPGYAVKIWKAYGDRTMQMIQENPYRIADEIWGMGFKTADRIALKLGVPENSPLRARACILYILKETAEKEGHVYLHEKELLQKVEQYLNLRQLTLRCDNDEKTLDINKSLADLERQGKAAVEDHEGGKIVYHAMYFNMEENAARRIVEVSTSVRERLDLDVEDFIRRYCEEKNVRLSGEQVEVLKHAAGKTGLLVVTGLPGTGKTSVCKALIDLYDKVKINYLLCAPTGRAAERLSAATKRPAGTIHRLLGYNGTAFERNRENPLDCDALLVDESSMVDIFLLNSLLEAVKNGTRVTLIGDAAQLPSVGPGDALRDVIRSGCATVVKLKTIFRQAEDSAIVQNAHRINRGSPPFFNRDFDFEEVEEARIPERLKNLAPELVKQYGDVQVLCPMNKGTAGIQNINRTLQDALNPPGAAKTQVERGSLRIRTGDRIIQLKNNYKKDVYNGAIGYVTGIDTENEKLYADFNGKVVEYDFDELDEIKLAYCISVHKSQGSEFKAVVLCLVNAHYIMLRRKLIYTAVTRAREKCLIIGDRKAVHMAIRNVNETTRNTKLAARVQDCIAGMLRGESTP